MRLYPQEECMSRDYDPGPPQAQPVCDKLFDFAEILRKKISGLFKICKLMMNIETFTYAISGLNELAQSNPKCRLSISAT